MSKSLQICCKLDNACIHVYVGNRKAHVDLACRLFSQHSLNTGTVLEKVIIMYQAVTPKCSRCWDDKLSNPRVYMLFNAKQQPQGLHAIQCQTYVLLACAPNKCTAWFNLSFACCVPAAFAETRFHTAANAKVVCTHGWSLSVSL